MARVSTPPPYFECPYKHRCPHLEGLSTQWVWMEYQDSPIRENKQWNLIDELDAELKGSYQRILALEKENAELKAKLQALHRKQFKANKKKRINEDSGAPLVAEDSGKKKRGAPVGHPGWFRAKPKHVTHTVDVPAPQRCPHCQSSELTPVADLKEHLQEDIVLRPRTVVTRYLHHQAYCKDCGQTVVQAGENELLNAPIGPVAKSVAVYCRYRMGLSYRKVQELFRDLFGLKFVPASGVGFDRKAVSKGSAIYEDLREKIRAAEVIHADETSWRNDGIGHYVWYAGNADLAFFHIDRHRSTKVAQSILGSDFNGVLVTDRYAAYNGTHPKDRQTCLAHLIRRAGELEKELSFLDHASRCKESERFCDKIANFFTQACKIEKKLSAGILDRNQAPRIEKQWLKDLQKHCAHKLNYKPAETLRTQLIGKERDHLFTFLRYPNVPPTNNQAEQSLRHMVIFRKVMFGTRSQSGLQTHSILPSLMLTAKRQGKHPREFIQTLLTADSATAQAALYNDSS